MADEEAVPGGLDEPWKRLRWARERKYKTKKAAADALNMPPPTYYGHENGTTDMPRDQAIRYATFFKISLVWLLMGKGSPRGSSPVQELFDEIPATKQAEVLGYLEYLANQSREPGR